MINRLIGGFVAVLLGVSLIGPLATQVGTNTASTNSTGATCTAAVDGGKTTQEGCQLYLASSWGTTVLKMVPGFYALGILGVGLAVTYGSLRDAGIV